MWPKKSEYKNVLTECFETTKKPSKGDLKSMFEKHVKRWGVSFLYSNDRLLLKYLTGE